MGSFSLNLFGAHDPAIGSREASSYKTALSSVGSILKYNCSQNCWQKTLREWGFHPYNNSSKEKMEKGVYIVHLTLVNNHLHFLEQVHASKSYLCPSVIFPIVLGLWRSVTSSAYDSCLDKAEHLGDLISFHRNRMTLGLQTGGGECPEQRWKQQQNPTCFKYVQPLLICLHAICSKSQTFFFLNFPAITTTAASRGGKNKPSLQGVIYRSGETVVMWYFGKRTGGSLCNAQKCHLKAQTNTTVQRQWCRWTIWFKQNATLGTRILGPLLGTIASAVQKYVPTQPKCCPTAG